MSDIGIIGLGIMGGAIAANIRAAGVEVVGYDPNPARCAEAAQAGVWLAVDIDDIAARTDTLLLSLPSPAAALDVGGRLALRTDRRLKVIEASTLALADKFALRDLLEAAGHVALDCPISGTGSQARSRDIVFYASGAPAGIDAVRPLLLRASRAVHEVGAFGNGSRMKFVANLLVAIHNVATAEAMALGERAGLDPAQMVAVLGAGAGTSRVFELRAPMMVEARYSPASMKLSVWQKDMAIIAAFAAELGSPVPLFSATAPLYDAALAAGLGEMDTAAVRAVLDRAARPADAD